MEGENSKKPQKPEDSAPPRQLAETGGTGDAADPNSEEDEGGPLSISERIRRLQRDPTLQKSLPYKSDGIDGVIEDGKAYAGDAADPHSEEEEGGPLSISERIRRLQRGTTEVMPCDRVDADLAVKVPPSVMPCDRVDADLAVKVPPSDIPFVPSRGVPLGTPATSVRQWPEGSVIPDSVMSVSNPAIPEPSSPPNPPPPPEHLI